MARRATILILLITITNPATCNWYKSMQANRTLSSGLYLNRPQTPKGNGDDSMKSSMWNDQARLMKRYMNISVDPCENMYEFACGNFYKYYPLEKEKNIVSIFPQPKFKHELKLRQMIKSITELDDFLYDIKPKLIKPQAKMKRFYDSCMDLDTQQARGFVPILDLFETLGGWPLVEDSWNENALSLEILLGKLNLINYGQLISVAFIPDPLTPDLSIAELTYGKASDLTGADFDAGFNSTNMRAYKTFILDGLELFSLKRNAVTLEVDKMIDLEKRVFNVEIVQVTKAEKSFTDVFERTKVRHLHILFPYFNWTLYLETTFGHRVDGNMDIGLNMKYLRNIFDVIAATEKRTIVNWLLWKILADTMEHLDVLFKAEKFQFLKVLNGKGRHRARWRTCLNYVKHSFGPVLANLYLRTYFDSDRKIDVLNMASDLKAELRDMIRRKSWLEEDSKKLTIEKLENMGFDVGYDEYLLETPKMQRGYNDLTIHSDKFFENLINVRRKNFQDEIQRFEAKEKRFGSTEFPFTVHNQNILYRNRIETTAAFLQPPMYDPNYPKAVNYGGVGFMIASQIARAFTQEGWSYNSEGKPRHFLDNDVIMKLYSDALCFREQYDKFMWLGHDINGENIWEETVSDSVGLKIAYYAYRKWYEENQESDKYEKERIPGINLSPFQLFFVRYAQLWCTNIRPDAMQYLLETDIRAYSPIRAIGTLVNSDEFSLHFSCDPGEPMNPDDKCEIW